MARIWSMCVRLLGHVEAMLALVFVGSSGGGQAGAAAPNKAFRKPIEARHTKNMVDNIKKNNYILKTSTHLSTYRI